MEKVISLTLLSCGIVLIAVGINATHGFGSDVSGVFGGSAVDKAVWMLVGGIIAAVTGLATLLFAMSRTAKSANAS